MDTDTSRRSSSTSYENRLKAVDDVIEQIRTLKDLDSLPKLVSEGRSHLDACQEMLDAVSKDVKTLLGTPS